MSLGEYPLGADWYPEGLQPADEQPEPAEAVGDQPLAEYDIDISQPQPWSTEAPEDN